MRYNHARVKNTTFDEYPEISTRCYENLDKRLKEESLIIYLFIPRQPIPASLSNIHFFRITNALVARFSLAETKCKLDRTITIEQLPERSDAAANSLRGFGRGGWNFLLLILTVVQFFLAFFLDLGRLFDRLGGGRLRLQRG